MSKKNSSQYVEWMWKSNLNPFSKTEPAEWRAYSEEESEVIEEAFAAKEPRVYLQSYIIDFQRNLQIQALDESKQRPVKRVVHSKSSWLVGEEYIGEGGFGKVYVGTYRGSQRVAYKVIKSQLSEEAMVEIDILKTLHHPSIVRYIDVIHTQDSTLLVMELIDGGTLYKYIKTTPKSFSYWQESINIMIDVAYAVSYLHEKNIIHADLKSDNILLRSNGKAVLSDFGLSKVIEGTKVRTGFSDAGALRWLSPELCGVRPDRFSFPSDVWAFGCVLLEIISKQLPWISQFPHSEELIQALTNKENAIVFQNICHQQQAPKKLRDILCACCTWFMNNRPTFVKIIRDLHDISPEDLRMSDGPSGSRKTSGTAPQVGTENSVQQQSPAAAIKATKKIKESSKIDLENSYEHF